MLNIYILYNVSLQQKTKIYKILSNMEVKQIRFLVSIKKNDYLYMVYYYHNNMSYSLWDTLHEDLQNKILKTHAIIFGISGFKLNLKEINFFKKYKPWGIILFSRNINNLDQVRNLTCSIRELFKDKNFPILIDQEGGKVNRFRKIINLDKYNAKYFGDIYKNNNIFYLEFNKFLKINISILKYCGININTVPVLDLFNKDKNSVIGNRAFSKKYNIDIEDLIRMNSLNKDSYLQLGQQLTIGNKNIHRNIESKKRTILYSVKQGDNLYKISDLFDVTVESIKEINDFETSVLMPGQIIKIAIRAF